MIRIYTVPTCSSCRKVKKWFDSQKIPYIEKNILSISLNTDELKDMLNKCENGTDDFISPKSKIIKESKIDIESMKTSELISFIQKNPSVLKRPIIVDDNKMQVGYNKEDISVFIPAARRLAEWSCVHDECPKYNECDHARDKGK